MDDDYSIDDDFKMTDVDIRQIIPFLRALPEFREMSKRDIYLFLRKEHGDTIKVGPVEEWEMNGEKVYTVGFIVRLPGTNDLQPLMLNFSRKLPWEE